MTDPVVLHDIVERLDAAAKRAETITERLAQDLDASQRLLAEDRVQIARLLVLNQRLMGHLEALLSGQDRAAHAAEVVASDLAASIVRADLADAEVPGAGADAALRSGDE